MSWQDAARALVHRTTEGTTFGVQSVNLPTGPANPSRKLALILLLLILLPLLFYSGYEINSLSAGEEVMREMYRR